jgi:hypothetical protein
VCGTISLLDGLIQLHNLKGAQLEKAKLMVAPLTGVVWTACNNLKQMPLTNKEVILKELNRSACTIRDAQDELSAAVQTANSVATKPPESEDDEFGDDMLEPDALDLAGPLLVILKATNSMMVSLASNSETGLLHPLDDSHTTLLEEVLSSARTISAATDEAACALYAFESRKSAHKHANSLAEAILQLLTRLRNHPSLAASRPILQRIDISNELIRKALEDMKK